MATCVNTSFVSPSMILSGDKAQFANKIRSISVLDVVMKKRHH